MYRTNICQKLFTNTSEIMGYAGNWLWTFAETIFCLLGLFLHGSLKLCPFLQYFLPFLAIEKKISCSGFSSTCQQVSFSSTVFSQFNNNTDNKNVWSAFPLVEVSSVCCTPKTTNEQYKKHNHQCMGDAISKKKTMKAQSGSQDKYAGVKAIKTTGAWFINLVISASKHRKGGVYHV